MDTGRALEWLCRAVLAMFVLALLGGVLLPVYTDEVGWRFQERAGFDGVDKMFNDICGANTLAVPPFFMWPVRWFSAVLGGLFADPLWVRLSGVLYALGFGALLWRLAGRIAPDRNARNLIAIIGFGLLCLGVQPFIAVMSRPEQPLLLAALGALLLALPAGRGAGEGDTPRRAAWLRSLGVLVLAVIAMSYHLKGLFLLSVFVMALLLASRGRAALLPKLAVGGMLTGATAMAAAYWIGRFQCPGDPLLRASFERNNLGAQLTAEGGLARWPDLLADSFARLLPTDYFIMQAPSHLPLSAWLPIGQLSLAAAEDWQAWHIALWSTALAVAGIVLAVALWRSWRARRIPPRLWLCAALLVTVLGWSATQLIRNVYEAGFVLPLLAVALVLVLAEARLPRPVNWGVMALAGGVALAALASPPLVAQLFGPPLIQAAGARGYVPGQPNSVPVFGYDSAQRDIAAVARQCGIADPATAQALLVDDTTYFAMVRAKLPQHRLGVLGLWRGTISDPVAYLKSRGSHGMVLGCHWLPPELRGRARQQGKFCCLAPPGW